MAEECGLTLTLLPRAARLALTASLLRSLAERAWREAQVDWALAGASSTRTGLTPLGGPTLPTEDLSADGDCPLVSILDAPRPRAADSLALLGSDGSLAAGAVVCRVPDPLGDTLADTLSAPRPNPGPPISPDEHIPMPFWHGDRGRSARYSEGGHRSVAGGTSAEDVSVSVPLLYPSPSVR